MLHTVNPSDKLAPSSLLQQTAHVSKYIPLVSSVTSVVVIIFKCIVLPFVSQETLLHNRHVKWIHETSLWAACLVLLPFIGNISIYLIENAVAKAEAKKQYLLEQMRQQNIKVLESLSPEWRNDGPWMLELFEASNHNWKVILYASDSLKDSEDFMRKVIEKNSHTARYLSSRLASLDDGDFVLSLLKPKQIDNNGIILHNALNPDKAPHLKQDHAFFLQAVQIDGMLLAYASRELRCSERLAQEAYKNEPRSLGVAKQPIQAILRSTLPQARTALNVPETRTPPAVPQRTARQSPHKAGDSVTSAVRIATNAPSAALQVAATSAVNQEPARAPAGAVTAASVATAAPAALTQQQEPVRKPAESATAEEPTRPRLPFLAAIAARKVDSSDADSSDAKPSDKEPVEAPSAPAAPARRGLHVPPPPPLLITSGLPEMPAPRARASSTVAAAASTLPQTVDGQASPPEATTSAVPEQADDARAALMAALRGGTQLRKTNGPASAPEQPSAQVATRSRTGTASAPASAKEATSNQAAAASDDATCIEDALRTSRLLQVVSGKIQKEKEEFEQRMKEEFEQRMKELAGLNETRRALRIGLYKQRDSVDDDSREYLDFNYDDPQNGWKKAASSASSDSEDEWRA